jgi:choline dehydrogenase-like flavoprotein
MTQAIALQNVRIFDGSMVLPPSTVVVQNGTITAVGNDTATRLAHRSLMELDTRSCLA